MQTAPVSILEVDGDAIVTLEIGIDSYTELGATVTDNDPGYAESVIVGGDVVDDSTIGTYEVVYTAPSDAAGNSPEPVSRTVQVVDTTSPIINLNGIATVTLEIAIETYTEDGAAVADNDPAYSETVSMGGDVVDDTSIGMYIVTYDAPADAAGNPTAQVTRTVEVVDTTSPVIVLSGDANVTLEIGVDSYAELGATVTDNDPAYSETMAVGGDTVDTLTLGTFIVTYDASSDVSGN